MGRAWILGIAILVVGLAGEREDGLMAALLALVAFTVYLATTLILRPPGEEHAQPMSKTRKILSCGFGGYLLLTVLAFIVFGSAGTQRGLQAAERVQARHLDRPAGLARHQQGGPLPVLAGDPDRA